MLVRAFHLTPLSWNGIGGGRALPEQGSIKQRLGMLTPVFRHGRIVVLAYGIGLAGIFLAATADKALALTPNSPEVKAAVDKGVAFLLSAEANDARVGGEALHGYALLCFGGVDHSHIKITSAAEKIHQALKDRDPAKLDGELDIYSTGLAIIFLIEHDPEGHRGDIEYLLSYLRARQKKHGGWGYPDKPDGDTSMTQYGVLSSWTAKEAGFKIPQESIENVAGWLMKTQDPSGAFGYQGVIGKGNELVGQIPPLEPSMTAAGSGSLYICAYFLGLIQEKEKDDDLPSALREVKGKEVKERIKTKLDARAVRDTEARAKEWMKKNKWLDANAPLGDLKQWAHYYLYALERCMSFRYLYDHTPEAVQAEPDWYNSGAEFLIKTQGKDGSWSNQADVAGPVPDTSFAILFLIRNTQKQILKILRYGEGTMIVGRGIPKNTDKIELEHGNIVAKPLRGPGEELLKRLENPDGREFDNSVELLAQLPADEVEKLKAKYGDKIRKLVGSKSPEARLAAVQTLAKEGRNLDNVETLIYALTDPDYRVVRAANDGLLRIRRVPTTVVLPENFSDEDRRLLVEKWKAWYQMIRPSAEVKY